MRILSVDTTGETGSIALVGAAGFDKRRKHGEIFVAQFHRAAERGESLAGKALLNLVAELVPAFR